MFNIIQEIFTQPFCPTGATRADHNKSYSYCLNFYPTQNIQSLVTEQSLPSTLGNSTVLTYPLGEENQATKGRTIQRTVIEQYNADSHYNIFLP